MSAIYHSLSDEEFLEPWEISGKTFSLSSADALFEVYC